MRYAVAAMIGAGLAALPRLAAACPTCISSGFGDRTYTWAYLGLLLMPLVVTVVIGATLAWYAGWRLQHVTGRISAWISRRQLSPRTHTETP